MQLTSQKRMAGQLMKCSPKRVVFDEGSLELIKEAITKTDIRALINSGAITEKPEKGVSRARARKIQTQKAKGRQKGIGSRKGKPNARLSTKETWINKVRLQRTFIKSLRDSGKIEGKDYRSLYSKVKGGFFRNKRHIKLFMEERQLIKK